jgi:hypothetical protein
MGVVHRREVTVGNRLVHTPHSRSEYSRDRNVLALPVSLVFVVVYDGNCDMLTFDL